MRLKIALILVLFSLVSFCGYAQQKLPLEEQKALAKKIFNDLKQLERSDYESYIAFYDKVIRKCPDTITAQVAYWKLANLYMYRMGPKKIPYAIELLENLIKKYPDTKFRAGAENNLIPLYLRNNDSEKLVDIYSNKIAKTPDNDSFKFAAMLLEYAEALEKIGDTAQAKIVYERVINNKKVKDSFLFRRAQRKLDRIV